MIEIFDKPYADPTPLFLGHSPWPMVIIVSSYLLFVLKLGRMFMANREPYKLRTVLKVYNLMQILYNGVLFIMGVYYIFAVSPHKLSCLTVMPLDHPLKNTDRLLSYAYYINKFFDMLDTVFFVLRKSYKQITALHLVHHLYMPISGYFVIRFNGYGGHPIVLGLLNLLVHVAMYAYYYLSSQSRSFKRKFWWKQYLTILQMTQLVLIFVHSFLTFMQPKCSVSKVLTYMMMGMSSTLLTMFANFYVCEYILPKMNKAEKKQKQK